MGRLQQLQAYKDKLAAAGSLERRESDSGVSLGVEGDANLAATLKVISRAIKKFEAGLAYDECPPELCDGEELDLHVWSLIVTDNTLATISRFSNERRAAASRLEQMQMVNGSFRGLPTGATAAALIAAASPGLISLVAGGATQVTDRGVKELALACPALEKLDLRSALQVGDLGVRELAISCTKLEELELSGCMGLEGPGLGALGDCCHRLKSIKFSGCRNIQPWAFVHLFKGAPELQELDLSHCPQLTDQELKSLAEYCTDIRRLMLKECPQVSDVGILSVSHGCTKLEALDVTRSEMQFRITDVGLLALGERCPLLSSLKVKGCDTISDVGLTWLSKGCPTLQYLDVNSCPKVGNAGVGAICEGCPDLQYLDITNNKRIGDTALRYLSDRCRKLHTLEAAGLFLISDGKKRDFGLEGIQALSKGCPELTTLNLSGVFQISTNALRAMTVLSRFRSLNFSHCPRITVKGISAALSGCDQLTDLNLSGCGDVVNNKMLQVIGKKCNRLQKISLAGCEQFGDPGLKGLLKDNIHVHTLDFTSCIRVQDSSMLILGEAGFDPGVRMIYLTNCPNVTDTGLSWLCDGCPTIHLLSLKGTRIHLTALQSIRDMFIYSELRKNQSFFGMWPLRRVPDRMAIDDYGMRVSVATKIQAMFRARRIRKQTERIRKEYYRNYLNRQINCLWRKRKGRDFLAKLRAEQERARHAATIIQGMCKIVKAREQLRHLQHLDYLRRANLAAIEIQRVYRGLLARRRTAARREELRKLELMKQRCAGAIQRVIRGRLARNVYKRKLAEFLAEESRKIACAVRIQKTLRSHWGRIKVEMKRAEMEKQKTIEIYAAVNIQTRFRAFKARMELARKRRRAEEMAAAAVQVQKIWRGIRARIQYQELRLLQEEVREHHAAVKLQCVWRAGLARSNARKMLLAQKIKEAEEEKAAEAIQQAYRGVRAKREAFALRLAHLEELQRMAELEIWSATVIQAAWRGKKGRDIYRQRVLQHMQRWKQMWDEEKQRYFYYNQISGEIRWRAPQDVLELMEKPQCSNCEDFEAFLECENCGEYFCSACWETVHYGGKRKQHNFRVLYDYYHKRIDYGDGEFPSKWPTEIEQDDIEGWQLRISPAREPTQTDGTWEQYVDEESGREFYYNTQTEESTYERPSTFTVSSEAISAVSLDSAGPEWTEHLDDNTSQLYYYNAKTGESTYEKPNHTDNTLANVSETASTNWTKHFDEEYQVEYFFNSVTGESTYDPPDM